MQTVTTMHTHQNTHPKPRNPDYRPGIPDVRQIITITEHGRYAQTLDIADPLDESWYYLDHCKQFWGWPIWWPGGSRVYVFAAGKAGEADQ